MKQAHELTVAEREILEAYAFHFMPVFKVHKLCRLGIYDAPDDNNKYLFLEVNGKIVTPQMIGHEDNEAVESVFKIINDGIKELQEKERQQQEFLQ